ncbi:hypothetical protein ALC62_00270 [Cyphomyrmex costatus]|uniref:Uncharacterized protein n=1 Tax=Cyphomyrmex costatus TaxID=456900 RepID=A0A195D8Q9_9HYME|nr:hypothetical protein ALC62_00270 [Cyphomyrmex costatus]
MFSTLRIPQIFIALDLTSRTKSRKRGFQLGNARP